MSAINGLQAASTEPLANPIKNEEIKSAIKNNLTYICEETLASQIKYEEILTKSPTKIQLINGISLNVLMVKN